MILKKIPLWVKLSFIVVVIFALVCSYVPYVLYSPSIYPIEGERTYLHIQQDETFADVVANLQTQANMARLPAFLKIAKVIKYDDTVRTGRYEIYAGMNYKTFVRVISTNQQTPTRLTFNNLRTKEQLASRIATQIDADSASIVNLLNDTVFILSKGLTPETAIVYFIPNTYEVYWTTTPEQLFNRMEYEYRNFWTEERREKAAAIPLTEIEVMTLASIIEEETNLSKELPIVAGLYINRLKKMMLLQADPTIKFAINDFTIRRVLNRHLETESPYNTYKNKGLPPGPIRVPSPRSIDAVLNHTKHNYLFMCAKETLNGEHNFAVTHAEHQRNAQKYREALNEQKIYR